MIKLKLIDRRNQEFEFTEGEHFLGRGPLLQINDPKCSKKQAKLVISEKKILLHSMGKNPMSLYSPQIGWRKIAKDQQTVLHNGDTINLLLNYYPYKISIENTEKKEKEDDRFMPDYNDSSQEASLIIEEVFAADPDPPTKNNTNNSTNGHKNSSNNNNMSRKVDKEDLSIDLNQAEDEPDSPQITNDGDLPPVSLADAISEENKKNREREADEKRKKDEELRKEAEKKKIQEVNDLKNLERKKEEERKQAQNSPKKNITFRSGGLFSQRNNTLSKDEVQLPEVKSSAPKFSLGSKLTNSPPPSPNKASGTTSTNNSNTLTGQKRSRENDSKEQSTPNKRAKTAVSRVIDLEEIDSHSEAQKRIEAEILEKKRIEEEDEELARKLQRKEEELEQKRKDKEFIDDDIDDSEGDFEDEKKSSNNKKNNKKKQQKSSGSKSRSTPKKKRVISSDDESSDSDISFDKPGLTGDDFYKRNSPNNATAKVTKSTVTVTKKGNSTSIPVDESSSGSEDIGKSPNKKTSPNKANNSPRKPTTRSNKKTAKVHTELKYAIDDDDFQ